MNNFRSTLLVVFLLAFSTKMFAQEKKVALVTFYCDKRIKGGGLGTVALVQDTTFNLRPALDMAYTKFTTEFAKDFPFKLIDKDIVSNVPGYKEHKSVFLWDTTKTSSKLLGMQYTIKDGLIYAYGPGGLLSDEKKDEVVLGKMMKDVADGIMMVSIDYEFMPGFGGVYASVSAYMEVKLFDATGKKIFTVRERADSKKKVPAVAGIPVLKTEKILPLCIDATEVLFVEVKDKIAKIVKKSAKF